jgi:type II secretory pathway pseudopilin PulG
MFVVLGVTSLLLALIMPAVVAAREKGRQATCISNLQQIGVALDAYRADHGDRMPFLLAAGTVPWEGGTDWFPLPCAYAAEASDGRSDVFVEYCKERRILLCPSDYDAVADSYGVNGQVASAGTRITDIRKPTETPLAFDAKAATVYYYSDVSPRHRGCANALYADYHVEAMGLLWTSLCEGAVPLPGPSGSPSPVRSGISFTFRVAGTPGNQVEAVIREDGAEFARAVIERTTGQPNVASLGPYFLDPSTRSYVIYIRLLDDYHGASSVWYAVNSGHWIHIAALNHERPAVTVDITSVLRGE